MEQTPILTLTLNPALDMSTEVPELLADQKLRCAEPKLDPGGGGLNVSRAVRIMGGDSRALVALGGLTGDRLAGLIRSENVPFLSLVAPGETRQSLTVTEATTGRQYRFMLPGPLWSPEDQDRVFHLLRASTRSGIFGVISGSQPPGVPLDFPAQLVASMPGVQVVLDTSGPTLHQAISHPIQGLAVLRMDGEEAESIAKRTLETRQDSADFASGLVAAGVAKRVIVARGAEGSVLAEAGQRLFVVAPKVAVKSKVGAGDSFVAGFVLALARGQDVTSALALGSAAASAAVMTDATQLCDAVEIAHLLPLCSVSPI